MWSTFGYTFNLALLYTLKKVIAIPFLKKVKRLIKNVEKVLSGDIIKV